MDLVHYSEGIPSAMYCAGTTFPDNVNFHLWFTVLYELEPRMKISPRYHCIKHNTNHNTMPRKWDTELGMNIFNVHVLCHNISAIALMLIGLSYYHKEVPWSDTIVNMFLNMHSINCKEDTRFLTICLLQCYVFLFWNT